MARTLPLHIAVVDDEPNQRYLARLLIETTLQRASYRLTELGGGQELLDLCAQEPVDLVILDMQMPDMHGLAVLQNLADIAKPKVVAWSSDDLALQMAADVGAHATAIKGTDGENLIAAIRGCVTIDLTRAEVRLDTG